MKTSLILIGLVCFVGCAPLKDEPKTREGRTITKLMPHSDEGQIRVLIYEELIRTVAKPPFTGPVFVELSADEMEALVARLPKYSCDEPASPRVTGIG